MFPLPKLVRAKKAPVVQALRLSEDSFSIRVESPLDSKFWIRVETPAQETITITDFNPGERPLDELETALVMALRVICRKRPDNLIFRDLISAVGYQPELPIRFIQTTDMVKRLANKVAEIFGWTVKSFSIEPDRNKLCAIVILE